MGARTPGSRPTYSGASQTGPRRLRIWTDSPPGAGASARRKGAGGGVLRRAGRAQGDEQQVAGLGRQVQPAQRFGAHVRQPAEQGAATAVLQDLLGGPEGVQRFFGGDPEQLARVEPPAHPTGDVRRVRRLHQGDGAARFELRQGRAQQADFTDAGLGRQQLDQRAQRPAAVRQLGRQGGVAGGQAAGGAARQLGGAPQRGMDLFWRRHGGRTTRFSWVKIRWAAARPGGEGAWPESLIAV